MSQPTFRSMRADGTVKRGEANSVRLEDIHEEPGFNELARDYDGDYEAKVDELVAYLEAGGVVPAIEVRPRPDGGVWIVQGHTRTRAWRRMDAKGTFIRDPKGEAWVSVTPFVGNDADRVLRLATSDKRTPVSALGLGRIYNKLIAMNWTVAQIAERSGEKPATIKRILDLAGGNTDVHEMVKAGEVKPTLAAAAVRKHGDKAGEVLSQQLEVAKANGKTKVTAAVTKLTFDQWFDDYATKTLMPFEHRAGYKVFAGVVWDASKKGGK